MFGYYGHGCREQCNCRRNQTCDRERGCIAPNTSYSTQNNSMELYTSSSLQMIILITCGVLIFFVLGAVYNLRRQLKKENETIANIEVTGMRSSFSANACLVQEGGDDIYSKVKESTMIENTGVTEPEKDGKLEKNRSMMTKMYRNLAWKSGENRPQLFRPYSFVKFHCQVEQEDNVINKG
ncbi:uncharacterized protein LOC134251081 [Saccostrea cucullata]|uniref:uncharacterized protein LOC134251081 n=1 Tax=Saccostrea cuccullata TaxID=36930 RepID=UPI002ED1090B